jgi:hypothetical protein
MDEYYESYELYVGLDAHPIDEIVEIAFEAIIDADDASPFREAA